MSFNEIFEGDTNLDNVLTLRYDPKGKPVFIKNDFNPKIKLENLLVDSLSSLVHGLKDITISLGGGIDSFTLLVLLRKYFPHIKISCISGTFSKDDKDFEIAEKVAILYDCDFKKIHLERSLENLPAKIALMDRPQWNLYQYDMMKECKTKALGTGDGGDEVFGGYTFRYQKYLKIIRPYHKPERRAIEYLNCHINDWVPDQKEMFVAPFEMSKIIKYLEQFFPQNNMAILDQVFDADFNGKLRYDWLPVSAKFSQHFGIKTIAPFLNPEVVKYGMSIPWHLKFDGINGKLPLRLLIAKFKHAQLVSGPKMGFGPNIDLFWKDNEDIIKAQLDKPLIVDCAIIKKTWLGKALKRNDKRTKAKLIQLLALEVWLQLKNMTMNKNTKL